MEGGGANGKTGLFPGKDVRTLEWGSADRILEGEVPGTGPFGMLGMVVKDAQEMGNLQEGKVLLDAPLLKQVEELLFPQFGREFHPSTTQFSLRLGHCSHFFSRRYRFLVATRCQSRPIRLLHGLQAWKD